MNYYERHLGDYAKAAGHLTLLEHGAFTLLLDKYYTDDGPIQAEHVYRLCRARTADEVAAVDAVLAEFFTLRDGKWHNKRAEEEIAKALVRISAARENGRRGGRKPTNNPTRTHGEPSGLDLGCLTLTQVEAHQAPSNHLTKQEQKKEQASPSGSRLPADWVCPSDWYEWAQQKRPDLDIDLEVETFTDHWHAKAGKDGRKANWQATWRNWIRNSRNSPKVNGHASHHKLSAVERVKQSAIEGERAERSASGNGSSHAMGPNGRNLWSQVD